MAQGISVIVTPRHGLAKIHVERHWIQGGNIVSLPRFVGDHGLTSMLKIDTTTTVESHLHKPKVVIGCVIVQVQVFSVP